MRNALVIISSLVLAGTLAACGSSSAGPTVTVTVPPSPATSAPTPTAGTSTAGNTSATNTATPGASPATTRLPGDCAATLSDYYVSQALGGRQLAGSTAFVVGVPDATIGRLSTINCRYGVTGTGTAAKAKVEIGVSLYRTDAQALARITATTTDYTARGATSEPVTLPAAAGRPATPATYLSGATGSGYELPLLVAATGTRTIAVTVDPAAVPSPPTQQAAAAIAQVAIQRTAG